MDHGLSERSSRATQPSLPYMSIHIESLSDQYDPISNPEGYISLTIAENRQCRGPLAERLARAATESPMPVELLGYNNMKGIVEMRSAVAWLMEKTFVRGEVPVLPEHLHVASGCGAVIDQLIHLVCDAGDVILVPAPFYPAFENDLAIRCGVRAEPVFLSSDIDRNHAAAFSPEEAVRQLEDRAAEVERKEGRRVRGLLVANPGNPIGRVYSVAVVEALLRWCVGRSCHFISDEIYANSVFNTDEGAGPAFVSALAVAQQCKQASPSDARAVDDLVHVIYGLSKDFCASGLRVGVLHTRNEGIHNALNNLSYFGAVSNLAQWTIATVLADLPWVQSFLEGTRKHVRGAWDLLTEALRREGIRYVPAQGSMFCWIDLRTVLKEPTWEEEHALWAVMARKYRLIITPGRATQAEAPGFFRVCFLWVARAEGLAVAVQRMRRAIDDYKAS